MSSEIIKFDNVTKAYSRYEGLLKIKNFLDRIKNFQFRQQLVVEEDFYALRDVSFTVSKGERIGLIGRNGAGKSTTLKLMSGITEPTSGTISVIGDIGGVLELGSGFHPELTARDNIYLQGALYGFSKEEIAAKVPIVMQISELDKFIDVPIKKFSSGMKAKLGFAVAMTTTPDIVLLDEVFAVGDAAFKKKSIPIMQQFIEGRTLFFVSHSMSQIAQVCSRVLVINAGNLVFDGPVEEGVKYYNEHIIDGSDQNSPKVITVNRGVRRGFSVEPLSKISDITFISTENGKSKFNLTIENSKPNSETNVRIIIKKLLVNDLSNTIYEKVFKIPTDKIKDNNNLCIDLQTAHLANGSYTLEAFAQSASDSKQAALVVKSLKFELNQGTNLTGNSIVNLTPKLQIS